MIKFEILNESEKKSFTSMLDWQQNYKSLKCRTHHKNAVLGLLLNKSGSNVSINACCEEFFRKIVAAKKNVRRNSKEF